MSPPASAISLIWRRVASTSAVSVLVIDCTATGAPPPIGTPPTVIWRLEATNPKSSQATPAGRRLSGVQRLDLVRVLLGDRLALELHRRGQLLSSRLPLLAEQLELLDLLHARQLLVGTLDPGADLLLRRFPGVVARLGIRIEGDQRHVVGPAVADRDRLADQRAGRLDLGLDVGRRHVLAGGVDDQLLLAVDDLQVAVLVELADVAGVQPAVVGEGLVVFLGQIAVS